MAQVVIIGAGEIGKALGKVIEKNAQVFLWDKNPERVEGQKPLEEIIPQADFLFLCVPSWAVLPALEEVKKHLTEKTTIISLTKGLVEGGKTMADVHEGGILGGPLLAEELMKGEAGYGVLGARREIFDKTAPLFADTDITLEYSEDRQGVALAGVLKNVYALALGMAEGLDLGDNTLGHLATQALKEMREITEILGGEKETILGNAGLADFIATSFSHYSANRETGEKIVKGEVGNLKSEGLVSLPILLKILEGKTDQFPLLQALKNIIIDKKEAKEVLNGIIK